MILQRAIQMSQIPTKDGSVMLRPSSIERIAQLLKNDDVDEAVWFMAVEENEARQREEQYAQQSMIQNAQLQQQSAMAAEQARRETIMMEAQMAINLEREKANVELMKQMQIQKMKNDGAYQIQLIKAKQELDAIELEAKLESELGNEITGRI